MLTVDQLMNGNVKEDLLTCGSEYVGRRHGNDLWTHNDQHVGRFYGDDVFAPDGLYLGEIKGQSRLITNLSKKHQRRGSFSPSMAQVGWVPFIGYVGNVMYSGYEDFPSLKALKT